MYCRFPRGYFFEVEKVEGLINFEEIEDMRVINEERKEVLSIDDIFEFDVTEEEDERCKCKEKKEKYVEHKCEKYKDGKCGCVKENDDKKDNKYSSKDKCKKEEKFYGIADMEYIEELEIKMKDCTCNCKK
ncbi:MAG: hypothetical protein ACRDDY_06695 [Clostridium sp.]|uniref:hypothetical protein n=1 Tax=Clostridium sp. TaxID=1506 RepID=UPI003EE4FA74